MKSYMINMKSYVFNMKSYMFNMKYYMLKHDVLLLFRLLQIPSYSPVQ